MAAGAAGGLAGCGGRTHVVADGADAGPGAGGSGGGTPGGDGAAADSAGPAGPISTDDAGDATAGDGSPPTVEQPPAVASARLLRRLTLAEYRNTIRDLLGTLVKADALAEFNGDYGAGETTFLRGGSISVARDVLQFLTLGETLAKAAIEKPAQLLPSGCATPAAPAEEDNCTRLFITRFGLRAFRRPLTDASSAELFALYRQRRDEAGATFADGIRVTLTAMLQSHNFLYRWELGVAPSDAGLSSADAALAFDGYERAARLSYGLWASMPDDALFEAAATGGLATPDGIATQARRLLADPRARDGLADFHMQWLQVEDLNGREKDPTAFPSYSLFTAQQLLQETRDFVASVLLDPGASGQLEALLTSQKSVIDPALAWLYKVGPLTGAAPLPVTYDPTQRAGILTQGAFLAVHADALDPSPFSRGNLIVNSLLCQDTTIPINIDIPPVPEATPGVSNRARHEAVTAPPLCQACHKLIGGLGYAFEHYDAVGAYRTLDNGVAVDSSGVVTLPSGNAVGFSGAPELLKTLVAMPEVRACVARQWIRWFLRRRETRDEQSAVDQAVQILATSGGDLREMIVGITRSRLFTHRSPYSAGGRL